MPSVLPFDVLDAIAAVLALDAPELDTVHLLHALNQPHKAGASDDNAAHQHDLTSFVQASTQFRDVGLRHLLRRISLPFLPDHNTIALCKLILERGWGCHVHALSLHERFECSSLSPDSSALVDALGTMTNLQSLTVDVRHLETVMPIDNNSLLDAISATTLAQAQLSGNIPAFRRVLERSQGSLAKLELACGYQPQQMLAGLVFPQLTHVGLHDCGVTPSLGRSFSMCFPNVNSVTLSSLQIAEDDEGALDESHEAAGSIGGGGGGALALQVLRIDVQSLNLLPLCLKRAEHVHLDGLGYHHCSDFSRILQYTKPSSLFLEFAHSSPLWLEELPVLAPQLRSLSVYVLFTSPAWLAHSHSLRTTLSPLFKQLESLELAFGSPLDAHDHNYVKLC